MNSYGIGIGVREFVVHAMISNPFDDAVLECHRLENHKNDL